LRPRRALGSLVHSNARPRYRVRPAHRSIPTQANLKSLGKYRQEGKNYVVKDGDIIEFKFNVSK
jgi:ribosome-binding ATPase YchF (GTP1/OBG family)